MITMNLNIIDPQELEGSINNIKGELVNFFTKETLRIASNLKKSGSFNKWDLVTLAKAITTLVANQILLKDLIERGFANTRFSLAAECVLFIAEEEEDFTTGYLISQFGDSYNETYSIVNDLVEIGVLEKFGENWDTYYKLHEDLR